ncbi:MAG: hypothetical protein WA667_06090 [Candidatus Nitrosopolaris sp.]
MQNLLAMKSVGLADEEDSIIDKRQKIYYPIIETENFNTTNSKESKEEINKLSISDRMHNILQHPRLLLPKDCRNIPDNWLEFEIFDLLKYPSKLDKFELYNEQNEQIPDYIQEKIIEKRKLEEDITKVQKLLYSRRLTRIQQQ